MEEKSVIELNDSSVVENDVIKRIRTTGIKGLDIARAKELGFFTRISNLLCAVHASIVASYKIYAMVDYMVTEFNCRKNEISREMNTFEKSFSRFMNFWTSYYASGEAGKEMNEETEILFRRIMEWAQLPFEWNLGDKQRTSDDDTDFAVLVDDKEKLYTFRSSTISECVIGDEIESWCVTKYDTKEHKQTTIEKDMDKASAMMVAKRLSSEDVENIYTASRIREYTEKRVDVTPFKAYKANNVVGKLTKQFK